MLVSTGARACTPPYACCPCLGCPCRDLGHSPVAVCVTALVISVRVFWFVRRRRRRHARLRYRRHPRPLNMARRRKHGALGASSAFLHCPTRVRCLITAASSLHRVDVAACSPRLESDSRRHRRQRTGLRAPFTSTTRRPAVAEAQHAPPPDPFPIPRNQARARPAHHTVRGEGLKGWVFVSGVC